ncbi:alpha/beta hydrolase [Yoonia sp. BS5-3]|uniref:Alpha/beta fold hydrolase n=1 Tax=Yoonia phaeophyticola TaxID=3137369 RepID=A0ABZ2V7X5_9RHOB
MLQIAGHHIHTATVGDGAPAVMIHCALSRHESLLPLAMAIGGQVTLFDMPGHGQSADWDGKEDYQQLVTKAAAACCDGPTHVIGHSFGATAALRLAVEHPDLVSRLTLIEPVYFAAAKGTEAHTAHIRAFQPFVGAMLTGDEERATQIFSDMWGDTMWDQIPPVLRRYLIDRIHLIVAAGAAIEEDADGITSPARLGNVNIPVTLIRGGQTQPVIGAIHAALQDRIKGAQDHVVPAATHMAPIGHAKDVAKIMRAASDQ